MSNDLENTNLSSARQEPLFLDLFTFFKNPISWLKRTVNQEEQNSKKIFIKVLDYLWISLFLSIVFQIFTFLLSSLVGLKIEEYNSIFQEIYSWGLFKAILLATIIGPFIEEVAFRLWLVVTSKNFLISLPFFLYYFITFIFTFLINNKFLENKEIYENYSLLLVLIISAPLFFLELKKDQFVTKNFIKKRFNFFFYFVNIIFGIIHLANFQNILGYWYLFPFLIGSQTALGILSGYIRVYFGFWWCFFSHFAYNFLLLVPLYLISLILDLGYFIKFNDLKSVFDSLIKANFGQLFLFILVSILIIGLLFYISWVFNYHLQQYLKYKKQKEIIK